MSDKTDIKALYRILTIVKKKLDFIIISRGFHQSKGGSRNTKKKIGFLMIDCIDDAHSFRLNNQ